MSTLVTKPNPLLDLWNDFAQGDVPVEALPSLLKKHQNDLMSHVSTNPFARLAKRQLGSHDVSAAAGYQDVLSWLTMASGRNDKLFKPRLGATHQAFKFLLFMDIVKRSILQIVHEALEPRFNAGELPKKGVLLAFTNLLEHAYMISFDFGSGRPEISIVDRIDRPRALFDLSHFPELKSQRAKNAAKVVLSGGHKIILHRSILTHVDRSADRDVFGPTIDTLLLAEETLEANQFQPVSVLEIGCGNGHIISAAAARLTSVMNAVFIDVNPHATSCTLRNLRGNASIHKQSQSDTPIHHYGVIGPFHEKLPLGQKFDLVISNPPYIATPPNFGRGEIRAARVAVSGTGLLEEIIKSAKRLLSPSGRMLVMTSSTSADAVRRALPKGFVVEDAITYKRLEVPFDVEDALDNPNWITWLESESLVKRKKDGFFHDLIPLWIRRSPR